MERIRTAYVGAIVVFILALGIRNAFPHRANAAPGPALDLPKYEVDPFWPKPLPDNWVTGDVAGTCIDAQDHVFIVNRNNLTPDEQKNAQPSPPVVEFDPEGKVVNSWGDRNVLPTGMLHGCTVDRDGSVWIGGNEDGIVQKYAHDGSKLLLQVGTRRQLDTSDGTPTGAPMNSSHTMLNRPASVAIDPTNGDVYIADGYGNRRVVVFDRDGHFLRQWGQQGTIAQTDAGVGGVFLATVHCIAIDNAGLVYVCDRKGNRVEVFDKMGNFQKNIYIKKGIGLAGSAWWVAFSRDSAQKYMYVADGDSEIIWVLDHATGQILSSFGRSGHQAGDFTFLHTIALDSKGNLIVGETINGRRVQKFKLLGSEPQMGSYHLIRRVPLGAAEGGQEYYDYLTLDASTRRLYLSHGTEVNVADADSGTVVGNISGLKRDHGIALVKKLGKGFISDGDGNRVVIFDPKTLKVTGEVSTGSDPDCIIYDPASKHIFTFNGRSKDATVIDPTNGTVVATIPMGGTPEFAVADGNGMIYDNNKDTNEVVEIDSRGLTIKARWPIAPAGAPTALAMDLEHRRLFIGGQNPKVLVVMDADNGKVIQSFPISAGVDTNIYEPETRLVFSSTRAGMIHIFHEDTADKFSVVETVKTEFGAKTMALDPKTHNLYLTTSDFGRPPAPTAEQLHPERNPMDRIAGTFRLLIYGR